MVHAPLAIDVVVGDGIVVVVVEARGALVHGRGRRRRGSVLVICFRRKQGKIVSGEKNPKRPTLELREWFTSGPFPLGRDFMVVHLDALQPCTKSLSLYAHRQASHRPVHCPDNSLLRNNPINYKRFDKSIRGPRRVKITKNKRVKTKTGHRQQEDHFLRTIGTLSVRVHGVAPRNYVCFETPTKSQNNHFKKKRKKSLQRKQVFFFF